MDELKIENLLNEQLIMMNVECKDSEDLIRIMANKAETLGFVKAGYADAVIERERLYPTGLPTEPTRVAVPHSMDRNQVISPVIIIAKPNNPVAFKEMGDGVKDVMCDIVFMLAICGDNDQLTVLQKIVGLFSEKEAMQEVMNSNSPTELIASLKKNLAN